MVRWYWLVRRIRRGYPREAKRAPNAHRMDGASRLSGRDATEWLGVPICQFCVPKTALSLEKVDTECMQRLFLSFCGKKMSLELPSGWLDGLRVFLGEARRAFHVLLGCYPKPRRYCLLSAHAALTASAIACRR